MVKKIRFSKKAGEGGKRVAHSGKYSKVVDRGGGWEERDMMEGEGDIKKKKQATKKQISREQIAQRRQTDKRDDIIERIYDKAVKRVSAKKQ